MRILRFRLMPVVMTAAAALLALKTFGLATHASYLFVPSARAESAPPATPDASPALPDEHGSKEEAKVIPRRPAPVPPPPPPPEVSASERALLEALQKRRDTLDSRASEIELRENLLNAAEKRLEERLAELKRIEETVASIDAKRAEEQKARMTALVTMYETMKVKEAARIFEKLDSGVLLDVASLMNPRKLSDVLGQMTPDVAQRLTVALARREVGAVRAASVAVGDLPKIEGHAPGR